MIDIYGETEKCVDAERYSYTSYWFRMSENPDQYTIPPASKDQWPFWEYWAHWLPLLTDGPCVLGSQVSVYVQSTHTAISDSPLPMCFGCTAHSPAGLFPGVCSLPRFAPKPFNGLTQTWFCEFRLQYSLCFFFCFMMILHSGERLILERLFLSGLGIPRDGEQLAWEHDFHRQTKPAKTLISPQAPPVSSSHVLCCA